MRKTYTKDTKEEALKRYCQCGDLKEIAKDLDVNPNTLRRWVGEVSNEPEEQELDLEAVLHQALSLIEKEKAGKSRSLESSIEAKLDRVFELKGTESELAKDIDQMVEKLLSQRAKLVEQVVDERLRLEAEIKDEVSAKGETVSGKYLQAVYSGGTRKTDYGGIENYAKTHPDVLNFISKGAPSIRIVAVKVAKKK